MNAHITKPSRSSCQKQITPEQRRWLVRGYMPRMERTPQRTLNPYPNQSGRTIAAQTIRLLINNVETKGTASKLNMLFGSFESMVAFAALVQLPLANTDV